MFERSLNYYLLNVWWKGLCFFLELHAPFFHQQSTYWRLAGHHCALPGATISWRYWVSENDCTVTYTTYIKAPSFLFHAGLKKGMLRESESNLYDSTWLLEGGGGFWIQSKILTHLWILWSQRIAFSSSFLAPDFGFCLLGSSDHGSWRSPGYFISPGCHAVEKMTRNVWLGHKLALVSPFCFDTDVCYINISLIVILNAKTQHCATQLQQLKSLCTSRII